MSEKPLNFRAFCVVALAAIGAVLCAYLFIINTALGITLGVLLCSALFAVSSVLIVKCRGGTAKLRTVIAFVAAAIVSVSAFCFAVGYAISREKCTAFAGNKSVSGRVCCVDTSTGAYRLNLDSLVVDGESADGIMRVTVAASDHNIAETVKCGDIVSFSANVRVSEFSSGAKINGTSYRSDIRYYASVKSEQISVSFGKPKPIEGFLSSLHRLLTDNMGDRYGNIAYSMLTGDKHALDTDISSYYSAAGLGHIMAVSGLHIGFLTVILNLLLCRADRRVRFGVISALLVLYCVIADFSPSVVRATIMAIVSMFALFVGGRRDILSSLCLACSLILAFRPWYLFEAGFLMSFGAILGIAMFSGGISRFLMRHGAHYRGADSIGTSVSVQAGILPAQTYLFGNIQFFAVLVNIVLIPYISVVFISVVVCALIGAIPTFGVVLKLPMYLLMPIDYIAQGIASVPHSSLAIYPTAAIFLCYPVMFVSSGFFMMPKGKLALIIASVFACSVFVLLSTVPPKIISPQSVDAGTFAAYTVESVDVESVDIDNLCRRRN